MISVVKGGKTASYYLLKEKRIEKIDFEKPGAFPLAYNPKNKNLALKSNDMFTLKLSVLDSVTGKYLKSVDLPSQIDHILSASFTEENSLALLYYDKNFKYFIAVSPKEDFGDFEKWNVVSTLNDATSDIISLHMLESSILPERPFSLQSGKGKNLYLHTTQAISGDLRVALYEFDTEKNKLFYKTSMFLPNTKGKINLFFNETDSTDYVYHDSALFMVQGGGFPEKHPFGEAGELLFSPLTEEGFLLYFIPRQKRDELLEAKVLKF